MKIKPIARVMSATALTNPDPAFVSLCTGPANQTPFHAVRSADGNQAHVKLEDTMKIKRSKATSAVVIAQKGHSVMQFAFAKSTFKTAEEVTAWLEAGGYQDYEITETSKAFEVADSSGTKFEVGSTSVIKNAIPGVTAYVGKLAGATDEDQIVDDATPDASATTVEATATTKTDGDAPRPDVTPRARVRTDAPGEPAAEPAQEPVAEPAAEPATTVEPVTEPVVQPVAGEIAIPAELKAKIDAVLAAHPNPKVQRAVGTYSLYSMADVISSLVYILSDAEWSGVDEATIAGLKTAALGVVDALVKMTEQYSTEIAQVFKSTGQTVARSAEPVVEEPVAAPAAEPATTEPAAAITAADVARMVADAVAPLTEQVNAANQRATDAETAANEARTRADTAESDLAARVEADENRSQSRKAADDLDPPASTTEAPKKPTQRSAANRLLESLGSRRAR